MKKIIMATFLLPLAILAGNSDAQESGGQNLFAYATYFECSPDAESRADEIISSSYKPHYDAAVEQGDIQSWSWMQHFVGGNWRRVLVIVTNNMESLLDASGALGEIISDQTPEAGRAFSGICSSHEDYIWQTVAGVGATAITANRGAAGFTVYMHCDLDREERADELFADVIGPVFDKHVAEGELTSWNWMKQYVGGKYRRILMMGASDHKTLLSARAAVHADLKDRREKRAVEEVNQICGEQQDYMWDILAQTP